jgi:hypothetical protein
MAIRDTQPKDPNYSYDGVWDFTRGVDSSRSPELLPEGYVSFGINHVFRQGEPHRRPAFVETQIVFSTPEVEYLFRYGKHQGEEEYDNPTDNRSYIFFMRGGHLLRMDTETRVMTEITIPEDPSVSAGQNKVRRHFFQQADKYLIIQNGTNTALIWDGITLRRSRDQQNNPGITNLTYTFSDGVGTVTTDAPHGLAEDDYVVIIGALPQGSNGTFKIYDVTTDTYKVRGLPSTLGSAASPAGNTFRPMEVPKGLFMEFVMGRLVVVSPDRRTMRIGDIIRSSPEDNDEQSVLWFTEELVLINSFVFSLPASQGRIRAVRALQFMGAPTGQGDLLISGDAGLSSLNLSIPRNQWRISPVQKIVMQGAGAASHTGVVSYNGDILFRDIETGIRSFRFSDSYSTKSPAQTPLSAEMNRIFHADNPSELEFTSMGVFDNRLLVTATPVFERRKIPVDSSYPSGENLIITLWETPTADLVEGEEVTIWTPYGEVDVVVSSYNPANLSFTIPGNTNLPDGEQLFLISDKNTTEYYHRGIVVLDYTISSGAFGSIAPGWDGLWTGLQPQSILKVKGLGRPRCYVCSFDSISNQNELWEIQTYEGYDLTREDQMVLETDPTYRPELIPAVLELPGFACGTPFDQKRIYGLDLHLKDLRGNIEISIEYRNDGDQCWLPWEQVQDGGPKVAEICAPTNPTIVGETNPFSDGLAQNLPQRRFRRLGYPSAYTCDPTTTTSNRLFFTTQLRITWTGFATWAKIRLMAENLTEDPRGGCWV